MKITIWTLLATVGLMGMVYGADPKVAGDIKVSVMQVDPWAMWNPDQSSTSPSPYETTIKFRLEGDALKDAIAVGKAKIEEAVDNKGLKLKQFEYDLMDTAPKHAGVKAVNPMIGKKDTPKDGDTLMTTATVTIEGFKTKTIAHLKGTILVVTPVATEVVTVAKILDLDGKEINDKRLGDAGVKVKIKNADADGMMLEITGNIWLITGARITTKSLVQSNVHTFEQGAGEAVYIGILGEMPGNATLELDLATQTKSVEVPFDFHDVEIKWKNGRNAEK